MSFKRKLAKSGLVRYLMQHTPMAGDVAKRYVPATTAVEAVQVARELSEAGYHYCLHHLGKTEENEIKKNVDVMLETIELLDDERLELCLSLTLSELGFLKSSKAGEHFSKQVARAYGQRIKTRQVQERNGLEDQDSWQRNFLMIHASERVPMQKALALNGVFDRNGIPSVATIPTALFRSEDDIKALVSQGSRVRLSLFPLEVADTQSLADLEGAMDGYMKLANILLSDDGLLQEIMPVFALEETEMAEQVKMMADMNGWPSANFEFEIPYGVNNELKKALLEDGYTVRVLVPYGREWWPYFQKRTE